jgi:hypothetical protein
VIPNTSLDVAECFGAAGVVASRVIAFPGTLPAIARAACKHQTIAGNQLLMAAGVFTFSVCACLWAPADIVGITAAIALTWLINRIANYVGARQDAALLEPCGIRNLLATDLNPATLTPLAKQWLELVQESGRDLHRFDIEIMSMLQEHEDLRRASRQAA